ncbi:hypothetical protein FQZ97_873830 [compost metagenome]
MVSKTVSDKLRAHLLAQGIDGIPANNTAVFNVLQDHGMLQPTADGKAIWRATVTSAAGWSHTFTLLRLAPTLIWDDDDRPAPFSGTIAVEPEPKADSPAPPPGDTSDASPITVAPARPATPTVDSVDALLALLAPSDTGSPTQAPAAAPSPAIALVEPSVPAYGHDQTSPPAPALSPSSNCGHSPELPSGEHFIAWLQQRIQDRKLIINDAKALVHTVADTVFLVSPGVFQRYAQEHPQTAELAKQDQVADWQWVQKRFEKLQLHRKQDNGLNIWTCEVTGPRKSRRLHGYLLKAPGSLFTECPLNNPYLSLIGSRAVE